MVTLISTLILLKKTQSLNPGYFRQLLLMIKFFGLVDKCTLKHPDAVRYTRREKQALDLNDLDLTLF